MTSLFGQAYMYEQTPFGISLNGGYALGDESQLLVFSGGLSFWGRIGISLGFGNEYSGHNRPDLKVSLYDINVLVFKEHFNEFPFSLGVGYHGQKSRVKSSSINAYQNLPLKFNSFYIQSYKHLFQSEDFNFYLGLNKGFGSIVFSNSSDEEKKSMDYVSASFTVHSKKAFVYLKPSYILSYQLKKLSQFSIAFGMIW